MILPDPTPNLDPVEDWTPPAVPRREVLEGESVRVEPLSPAAHGDDLWAAFSEDEAGALWTYRYHGPFADRAAFDEWLEACAASVDPHYFAYVDRETGRALGNGSYLEIKPEGGSIEVGYIAFSPAMQRTRMATEAMFLMMKQAFDLGYRRYEWTCHSLNAGSMQAAARLGFSYEATHRWAAVSKGANRDMAIFSVLDREWPALRAAFEAWLAKANFDGDGRQRESLSALIGPLLKARATIPKAARINDLGQPVGFAVEGWTAPTWPPATELEGRFCTVVPLDIARHGPELFAANTKAENWAWLPYGPYDDEGAYLDGLRAGFGGADPMAHAILIEGRAVGIASLMRINPAAGSIEVGHINLSPCLQQTRASTEAMHLMMARAFALGYRRYEWKCDAANGPSRRAAERLGFVFEGVTRQATIVKGRNRDTAWFSITAAEWPRVHDAQVAWLGDDNFDASGAQIRSLEQIRDALPVG